MFVISDLKNYEPILMRLGKFIISTKKVLSWDKKNCFVLCTFLKIIG